MRDAPDSYEAAEYDNPHRCATFRRLLESPPFMSPSRQKHLIMLARTHELAFLTNHDAEMMIREMGLGEA